MPGQPAECGGVGLGALQQALGVDIDTALLTRALTHRSYSYEQGGCPHNERLEFLGDSVLGLVVTDTLYRSYPDLPEGQLAKLRASVVNMRALAEVGRRIGLGQHLRLGRGEEATGGRDKASILADGVEALLGAIHLDGGLAVVGQVVHRLFDSLLTDAAELGAGRDWKTSLQELAASLALGAPWYEVSETGPDHNKEFTALAHLGGDTLGRGIGSSKKVAEQHAAEQSWQILSARADASGARTP